MPTCQFCKRVSSVFWWLQDFSEAADALGPLNLSEGWSSLSLRSRHSESGAQDAELRAQRGDPFEASRSNQDAAQDDEEDQYASAQTVRQLNRHSEKL